jgi:hypothetical protein
MKGYTPRGEKQAKNAKLVRCLSGTLRRHLPDSWITDGGGVAGRFTVFHPLVTVWCMLRQSMGPDQSCGQVLSWLQAVRNKVGLPPISTDTGGYCKARQRLSPELFKNLADRVGGELSGLAGEERLWHGRRVIAADGSAFSMPDTLKNQKRYPQPKSQRKGCGFPIAGFVSLMCMATGAMLGASLGTCNVHDLALFWFMRPVFQPGDIFLGDRGFASFAEMALFRERGIDSVLRLHQRRRTDFRRGRAIGRGDHVVKWLKPPHKPKGLSEADWKALPDSMDIRELRYRVFEKGFRTTDITLSTTLLDAEMYPAKDLAELYFRRWRIEVEFRHLKITLQMDVCRAHSPDVVEQEFWAHVLAHNLVRRVMWESGLAGDVEVFDLSFKSAARHMQCLWVLSWDGEGDDGVHPFLLSLVASELLPVRPGRVEPRVRKRRPKNYSLMSLPRNELRKKLPIYHC